ncbi:MAG: class I SAM-dependent methyltransferase [Bacteroidota bacterium]
MRASFGIHQINTSKRMANRPQLAKIVKRIFGYTHIGNFARSLVFKRIINEIPLEGAKEVLDLGCGYGDYAFMMAESFPYLSITALELQANKVNLINEVSSKQNLPNLKGYLGKIETLPNRSHYDLIYSVDVFEHILEHEMPFEAAFKRLKPGGHLLVKMPSKKQHIIAPESWFGDHKIWLDEEHIGQVYELEDLKNRFIKEGFEIEFASYTDGWWSRLGWELGYFAKKMGPVFQLLTLPVAKLFVRIDNLKKYRKKGNAIQVIGRKPK